MITCNLEGLNITRATALRRWLDQSEFSTLVEVANAKVKAHAVKALNQALEGGRYEAKLDAANEDLKHAQRFQTFIDVLQEIAKEDPYQIAKLQ